MKKKLTIIVIVFALLLMAGCKSDAAKAAIELITAIGEVSLDNEQVIIDAEDAVAALEEKDLKQVDNLEVLEAARATFNRLVEEEKQRKIAIVEDAINAIGEVTTQSEDLINAAQKAYDDCDPELKDSISNYQVLEDAKVAYKEALDKEAAKKVDDLIDAIGTVTLNSKSAIDKAYSAYNSANYAVKKFISKYDNLTKAKSTYDNLVKEKEDTEAANKVISLISAIGDVDLNSLAKIEAAEKAYNALTSGAKSKVSNRTSLTAARNKYDALRKEENQKVINSLLGKMRAQHDAVRKMSFYYHPNSPVYTNTRSYVLPYIGRDDSSGRVWLCLECDYYGDDWVFWKKIIFSVDGKNTTKTVSYWDVDHDNWRGMVWEYYNTANVTSSDIKVLKEIANSTTTIIRFEGDNHYYDLTVSASDKAAIREILALYEAWGGK